MSTYFTDFEEYSTGSKPSDWTVRINADDLWTVETTGSDKYLQVDDPDSNQHLSWDDIDADSERQDVEILFKWQRSAGSSGNKPWAFARLTGNSSAFSGYRTGGTGSNFQIYRAISATAWSSIGSVSFTHSGTTDYWVRFRVNGTTVQARIWLDGDSEPGTWDIDVTDSNISGDGWAGVGENSSNATTLRYWQVGVGTNGDAAPDSAPSSGNTIAVPAGALTLTKYAPTVVATANQTVAVPAGSLTLTAYAPTVTAGANQVVAVPAGSLSLTGFAPTVQVTSGSTILVPAGALSLTGYAPTVVNPNTVAVPAGSITLTGYAPTVVVRADQIVAVPAATLTLTGFAPGVAYTANNTISVPAGALSLTGYAPTVSNGEVVEVKRQTGAGRPRRRQRVVIAIDGEDFVVESEEEAVALLDQAKEAAQEKAEQAIKRAAAARKREPRKVLADARKALEVPTITAEGMSDYAAETVAAIEELYRSAMRTIEVAAMLSRRDRDEEDDEEVLLLLA